VFQKSVAIVDDNDASRESFGFTVEDAHLNPLPATGPLGSLANFRERLAGTDFLLSDYELRARNYANFTGAELVAQRQRSGQPSVLCTKYEKPQVERIRPYRRWIPALLAPDELTPDILLSSLERCIGEIRGEFEPAREPWRALVRFVEEDPETPGRYFVELPSWSVRELLPVSTADLPEHIASQVAPDFRCHAMINLDSERYEDLYFDGWEVP
jgi:hypothetical protein